MASAGVALRYAAEGAHVVLAVNEEQVHAVAAEIQAAGGEALSLLCDVTDRCSVQEPARLA